VRRTAGPDQDTEEASIVTPMTAEERAAQLEEARSRKRTPEQLAADREAEAPATPAEPVKTQEQLDHERELRRRKSERMRREELAEAANALRTIAHRPIAESLDQRTKVAREMTEWYEGLVRDLGGRDSLSVAQLTMVELAARQKVLLDGVDGWVFSGDAKVVQKNQRKLYPIVIERQRMVEALVKILKELGLERRRPTISLDEYVQAEYEVES
jgi:hypothetical protein